MDKKQKVQSRVKWFIIDSLYSQLDGLTTGKFDSYLISFGYIFWEILNNGNTKNLIK